MAAIKCKMCGGDLIIEEGSTVAECEYCGSRQTVPNQDDDKKLTLFARANRLRMGSEFDKAAGIYESIVADFPEEAEAYWGLVLCKYGIEYVDDPATGKKIPTCHRSSFDSVMDDKDLEQAFENADPIARRVYREEATQIEEIRRGIIEVSGKEEPYDIFICYKETAENGDRTIDSLIAQDAFDALTGKGYRVFFSRITLEDKLGQEYEPYIFAALNSAKIMLAFGTDYEYYNAVWVKNEWSRYLKLMAKDKSRHLIPCYKNIDAYDMPKEFARLQAQDMGKVGAMQDLLRGIEKVLGGRKEKEAALPAAPVQQNAAGTTASAQIKRGNMALEDHDWAKADSFFEEALNLDPECAEAYLGKLFAREQKPGLASWLTMQKEKYSSFTTERLDACPEDTEHIAKRAAECTLAGYLDESTIRKEYIFDRGYDSALSCRKSQREKQLAELQSDRLLSRARQYAKGTTQQQLKAAVAEITAALDKRIADARAEDEASIATVKAAYHDRIAAADKKAEALNADARSRREQDYQTAVSTMEAADQIPDYEIARQLLRAMNGYRDSEALADRCQKEIDRLNEEARQARERQAAAAARKRKTMAAIAAAVAVVCIAVFLLVTKVIIPNNKYNAAVALMEAGQYEDAIAAFEAMDGYKDSAAQIENCQTTLKDIAYNAAVALMEAGQYEQAIAAFEAMGGYKDSAAQLENCYIGKYGKETWELIKKIKNTNVGDIFTFGAYEQDNNTSNGKEDIAWIVLAKEDSRILVISEYALDCQPYNTSKNGVTWESCSLRDWLNGTFWNAAFSPEEQAKILNTTVSADQNPEYRTNPGNATTDKVFLLSINEAEKYFNSDEERTCAPTAYAKAQGAYTNDYYKTASGEAACWWWLRSSGSYQYTAAGVSYVWSVNCSGDSVERTHCVRPALWIGLNA